MLGIGRSLPGPGALICLAGSSPSKSFTAAGALKAIKVGKTLAVAGWGIIGLTLQEKKHVETASWLARIERELKMEMADLTKRRGSRILRRPPERYPWADKSKADSVDRGWSER